MVHTGNTEILHKIKLCQGVVTVGFHFCTFNKTFFVEFHVKFSAIFIIFFQDSRIFSSFLGEISIFPGLKTSNKSMVEP